MTGLDDKLHLTNLMQGYGEKLMKTIKSFMVALGLLAISSTSYASSFMMGVGTAGSEGTISFDGVNTQSFSSQLVGGTEFISEANTDDVFFDLVVTTNTDANTIVSSFHINPVSFYDVFVQVFLAGVDNMFTPGVAGDDGMAIATGNNGVDLTGLLTTEAYYIQVTAPIGTNVQGEISAVPVPAAGILFASALFGAGFIGRRKKKAASTTMTDAFARAA